MNSEEVYNAWKGKKSQIDIPEDFADEVMNQVYRYSQKKKSPLFDLQWLVEMISAHPLVKAGLVVASAVVGFLRIAFVVCMFLGF